VEVEAYDLLMDIDFEQLKFKGTLKIKLRAEQDVTLNSVGLEILHVSSGKGSHGFSQKGEDLMIETGPFDGALQVEYEGSIPDSLAGIYRAPYDKTHIISTHFEAAQARRMFPCVDRPDKKAEFKLAARISKDLDAISNMPVETVRTDGEKKVVTFQKTPRMSTYLLYLGVGKFEVQKGKVGKTDILVATTPGKTKLGEFAQEEARSAIRYFNTYYKIQYALPKLHLIAVPEFAMGAMENWGAITFRELLLLVDANTSTKIRRRVSQAVAHELAHQWFGDLVTMKWWDDIWLNESFATFMAYKAVDSIHPDWEVWRNFFNGEPRVETLAGSMGRDCLKNTHPIQVVVNTPDEIEQIFDAISYGKGGHVLQMIEAYIGEQAFREGVRHYLSAHAYSNATGNDLWSALEDASGKKVKMIMSRWVQQPGYPVLTVSLRDGKLNLKQERFLISGDSEKVTWPIPVILEVNGKRKSVLMETDQATVAVDGLKSLRVNPDRTGFYSVHYVDLDAIIWDSKLSPYDKWGIAFDSFQFLVSGRITFMQYLQLIERFGKENELLPIEEVSDQLALLYSLVPSKVVEISRKFHSTMVDSLQEKTDENSSMLRGTMAGRLASVDLEFASKLAGSFKEYEKVSPDMKLAVAEAYARSTNDFEGLRKAYDESNSDEYKTRILTAMMSFTEAASLQRAFDFALSGQVKRQDVIGIVRPAAANPEAKDIAWNWLQSNIAKLQEMYHRTGILPEVFLSIIPILGTGRVQEMEDFFDKRRMPDSEVGIRAGLERLRAYDRLVRNIMQT
jgi:tricorn protease interacting factor F2/3